MRKLTACARVLCLGLLWQRRVGLRRLRASSRRRRVVAAGDGLDPPPGKLREKRLGRGPVADQFPSVQKNGLLRRPGEQAPARCLLRYLELGAVERIPDVADHDLRTSWVRHAGNRSTVGAQPSGIRYDHCEPVNRTHCAIAGVLCEHQPAHSWRARATHPE